MELIISIIGAIVVLVGGNFVRKRIYKSNIKQQMSDSPGSQQAGGNITNGKNGRN